jgi:hypothetical protein
MSKEPTFAKLLQEAVNEGHIILVPPPSLHGIPLPPPRARDATALTGSLCTLFRLTGNQGRVLAELMLRDCCGKAELRAVATPGDQSNSISVTICTLRKRLKPHGIRIVTTWKIGYALDAKSRSKLRRLLAEQDAAIMSAPP